MATSKLSGNIVGLEINGEFVACETSCEIVFDTDMRPASPPDDGGWKSFIPGISGWSVNLNAFMLISSAPASQATFLNAFMSKSRIGIRVASKFLGISDFEITGYVYVQSGGITASVNSSMGYNMTLLGDGAMNGGDPTPTGDVEFGFLAGDPTGSEGSLVPQYTKALTAGSLALNFSTGSTGNYLYFRFPTGGAPYIKWENNVLNFGDIPDFVWKAPYDVGGKTYYVTRNLVYFTSAEPIITFKKS